MKKYLPILMLLVIVLPARAQSKLQYGQSFLKTPVTLPHVYLDLLRNQQPYIQVQNRKKWSTPDAWDNVNKYISDKNTLGYFTLLEDHIWMNEQWNRNGSYGYEIFMDALGQRVVQVQSEVHTQSNDYKTRVEYEYNASGDLSDIIYNRAEISSSDFFIEKVQYFRYDSLHRMISDSLVYMEPVADPIITNYIYKSETEIEAILYIQGDTGKIDTVKKMYVTNDDQGRLVSIDEINYFNNVPLYEYSNKQLYMYDDNGNVGQYERYNFTAHGMILVPSMKVVNTFRSDTKLAGWTVMYGNTNTGKWVPDHELDINYDMNDEADSANVYFFNQDIFIPDYEQRLLFMEPVTNSARSVVAREPVIYPNPAGNYIHIPGTRKVEEISIQDMNGRIWWQNQQVEPGSIDISLLKPGVYWLHMTGYKPVKLVKI